MFSLELNNPNVAQIPSAFKKNNPSTTNRVKKNNLLATELGTPSDKKRNALKTNKAVEIIYMLKRRILVGLRELSSSLKICRKNLLLTAAFRYWNIFLFLNGFILVNRKPINKIGINSIPNSVSTFGFPTIPSLGNGFSMKTQKGLEDNCNESTGFSLEKFNANSFSISTGGFFEDKSIGFAEVASAFVLVWSNTVSLVGSNFTVSVTIVS